MKSMCRHQTLYGLPKHCPKKINKSPCTIFYTAKMTTINKNTTVDTIKLQRGELIQIYSALHNVTPICGLKSMLDFVFTNIRMLWVSPTVYKRAPVCIIRFIPITLDNEKHPLQTCNIWLRWRLGKLNRCHELTCWRIKNIHGKYWWWCILTQWKE